MVVTEVPLKSPPPKAKTPKPRGSVAHELPDLVGVASAAEEAEDIEEVTRDVELESPGEIHIEFNPKAKDFA